MLSIVLPSYNEEGNVENTNKVLSELLVREHIPYELVFVNDGSKDNTQEKLESICAGNPNAHYILVSRNFGKEAAISAGLGLSKGDCVAVMDCDLQHPPAVLVEMYRLWEKGYEVIEGVKRSRGKESGFHAQAAKTFYGIMSRATDIDMSRASDFKLLDRKAVNAVLSIPEYHSFFRALSSWIGFKTTTVEFDVQERAVGESKWSTIALIRYAVDNIMEFSSIPMQLVTGAGAVTFIIALALGIQTLVRYFCGKAAEGFTTVIVLQLFLGGILMIGMGIIGMYISKIYDEVKRRPKYIISRIK